MRKYKVIDQFGDQEFIEADSITAQLASVLFQVNDDSAEFGSRTIAIRMNCNVTEEQE